MKNLLLFSMILNFYSCAHYDHDLVALEDQPVNNRGFRQDYVDYGHNSNYNYFKSPYDSRSAANYSGRRGQYGSRANRYGTGYGQYGHGQDQGYVANYGRNTGYEMNNSAEPYSPGHSSRAPASVGEAASVSHSGPYNFLSREWLDSCEQGHEVAQGNISFKHERIGPSSMISFDVGTDILDLERKGNNYFLVLEDAYNIVCHSWESEEWSTSTQNRSASLSIPLGQWVRFGCTLQGDLMNKKVHYSVIQRDYNSCGATHLTHDDLLKADYQKVKFKRDGFRGFYKITLDK
jgi:hypothetical protein